MHPHSGSELERAGGQAVIEGVMMRSRTRAAVAVRLPDGSIAARILGSRPISSLGGMWRRPVLRGAAALIDSIRLGMEALNWSGARAEPGGGAPRRGGSLAGTALGAVLAVLLFGWLPLRLGMLAFAGSLWVNMAAGALRIAGFVLYIRLISMVPSIGRVFLYHGAEHQAIHAWEEGPDDLERRAEAQSPVHPRGGTSFMLLLMMMAIAFYSVVDTLVTLAAGRVVEAHWRVLYHLPMLPVVTGLSYEVLRLLDRRLESSRLARLLSAPGLLMQRMTTRKAGAREVEVAVTALKLAVGIDPGPSVALEGADG